MNRSLDHFANDEMGMTEVPAPPKRALWRPASNSASAPEAIAPTRLLLWATAVERPQSEAAGLCRDCPRAHGKIVPLGTPNAGELAGLQPSSRISQTLHGDLARLSSAPPFWWMVAALKDGKAKREDFLIS
jgi:hypothetical protein